MITKKKKKYISKVTNDETPNVSWPEDVDTCLLGNTKFLEGS